MAYIFKIYMVILVSASPGFAALYNEFCSDDTDCVLHNMVCSKYTDICEETCRCADLHYPVQQDGNYTCLPYLKLGDNCSSGRCETLQVCDDTKTCVCHRFVKQVDDTCVIDWIGQPTCSQDSDCAHVRICTNGACVCPPHKMEDTENGYCRDASYQDSCANGVRCGLTFVCDTNTLTCQCPEDFRALRFMGNRYYACFPENATFGVEVGGVCSITFDETGVYCRDGLTCVRCYYSFLCTVFDDYGLTTEAPTSTLTPGNGGSHFKGNGLCQHGCANGGTCSLDEDGFFCACEDQFYGQLCQHSCSDKCGPHGHCSYTRHGPKYTCECDAGWTNAGGQNNGACDVSSTKLSCMKCTGGTNLQNDCYWIDCPHQHFCWANDKGNRYWRGCSSGCPHDVRVCCTTDQCNGYDWFTK